MYLCAQCHPKGCKSLECDFKLHVNLSKGKCERCGQPAECVDCHASIPLERRQLRYEAY